MTKTKGTVLPCIYCERPVDIERSHARNMTTGRYCHIDCFMQHEPQGRALVEEAKQRSIEEFELATTRRTLH